MRTLPALPRQSEMKHLSSWEQKKLIAARRHRCRYLRQLRLAKLLDRSAKHAMTIPACVAGLFVCTTLQAAEPPAVTAPAYFNEANAAQRAGHFGPAILGYERARVLAPRDRDIGENLRVAREKAGVPAPTVPAWQKPAHTLGLDGLAMLASISLLLFSLLVFGSRFIPTSLKKLARVVATTFGATALIAASAVALRWPELSRAVIQGLHATAHIAPAASSGAAFELKPGELVTARREHGDFVLVRTLDQRSGWVAKADVERVIPAAANPSPM